MLKMMMMMMDGDGDVDVAAAAADDSMVQLNGSGAKQEAEIVSLCRVNTVIVLLQY